MQLLPLQHLLVVAMRLLPLQHLLADVTLLPQTAKRLDSFLS